MRKSSLARQNREPTWRSIMKNQFNNAVKKLDDLRAKAILEIQNNSSESGIISSQNVIKTFERIIVAKTNGEYAAAMLNNIDVSGMNCDSDDVVDAIEINSGEDLDYETRVSIENACLFIELVNQYI